MKTTVVAALSARTSRQPTTIRHTRGRRGTSSSESEGGGRSGERCGLEDLLLGGAAVPLTPSALRPPSCPPWPARRYDPAGKRLHGRGHRVQRRATLRRRKLSAHLVWPAHRMKE